MADDPKPIDNGPNLPPLQFRHVDNHRPRSEQGLPADGGDREVPDLIPWTANLPSLDSDRLASARASWVNAGKNLATPELRAEHLARFDEAAAADNPGYVAPDGSEALMRQHGLSDGNLKDIRFEYDSKYQMHSGELASFVSAMRMNSGLGAHLVEVIAKEGPALQQMSKDQRSNWLNQQTQTATKLCGGSKEKLEAAKKEATEMLNRLKSLPDNKGARFARDLLNSDLFNHAFLITSLATQNSFWKSYEVAAARRAKAGKR
jgi:hypothetical protein